MGDRVFIQLDCLDGIDLVSDWILRAYLWESLRAKFLDYRSRRQFILLDRSEIIMSSITILENIKFLLKDYHWHGCSELIAFGLSYRNRISEWQIELSRRNHPICIASEREFGKETFRYKLARRVDCREIPMQGGTRFEMLRGTPSEVEGVDLLHPENTVRRRTNYFNEPALTKT